MRAALTPKSVVLVAMHIDASPTAKKNRVRIEFNYHSAKSRRQLARISKITRRNFELWLRLKRASSWSRGWNDYFLIADFGAIAGSKAPFLNRYRKSKPAALFRIQAVNGAKLQIKIFNQWPNCQWLIPFFEVKNYTEIPSPTTRNRRTRMSYSRKFWKKSTTV